MNPFSVPIVRNATGAIDLRPYFAAQAFSALITVMMSRRDEAQFLNFDESAIHEAARLSKMAANELIKQLSEEEPS